MSETLKAPNKSHWDSATLTSFANWVDGMGLRGIDVWRSDLDHTNATQPWMLGVLERFAHGGHGQSPERVELKSDDLSASAPRILLLAAVYSGMHSPGASDLPTPAPELRSPGRDVATAAASSRGSAG